MTATFSGEVIAESDETIYLEGNHYLPARERRRSLPEAERDEVALLLEGAGQLPRARGRRPHRQACRLGLPPPLPWIRKIRDHVAFWDGVEVKP
jgi:uncharacterized protein (DUF427 family)